MRDHAPCGVCRAYVSAVYGCGHWKPGQKAARAKEGQSRSEGYLARKRERNRAYQQAARARAKQDVAAFREAMEVQG